MTRPSLNRPKTRWRRRLHGVIFEAETPAGKAFDVVLIWSIACSVAAAMLESVSSIRAAYGSVLYGVEWFFTILFTVEYGLRLLSLTQPRRYMMSFFGVVDVLAVVPTYLSVVLPGSQYFLTVRVLRLLRIFRILKLSEEMSHAMRTRVSTRACPRCSAEGHEHDAFYCKYCGAQLSGAER